MRLLKESEVRLLLGMGALDVFVNAASEATDQATLEIENDLRTPLLQASYSDVWLLGQNDAALSMLKLKTTAGFITGDVTVGMGESIEAAQADDTVTTGFVIDKELGVLTFVSGTLARFISVRYTAGFVLENQNGEDILTGVPDWMKSAAKMKAAQLMASNSEFDGKDGDILDAKDFRAQYASLLTPRIRYVPLSRMPIG